MNWDSYFASIFQCNFIVSRASFHHSHLQHTSNNQEWCKCSKYQSQLPAVDKPNNQASSHGRKSSDNHPQSCTGCLRVTMLLLSTMPA